MHRIEVISRRSLLAAAALGSGCLLATPWREAFAADAEDENKRTATRLATLKTCDTLTAAFRYFGDQDKPFYRVTLSTEGAAPGSTSSSFDRWTKLDRDEMAKLLDALAEDGFVGSASDVSYKDFNPPQGYYLTLTATKVDGGPEFEDLGWPSIKGNGHVELYQPFGWDLNMIERLERLLKSLKGDAVNDMQMLLGRLTGLKRQWEQEAAKP